MVKFTIQTNGYLLDKKFIEFVYKNNIALSVSIDGPKEIHDRCRKLHTGEGTFDKIISNLKFLYEIDEDYYKANVSINYAFGTRKHFHELINFHNTHPLMRGLKLKLNYVSKIGLNENINYLEMIKSNNPNSRRLQSTYNNLDEYFWNYVKDMSYNIRFEDVLFTRGLLKIIYRKPVNKNELVLKGPCIPGSIKLFVSTDGGYKVCEKTSRLPLIGNVIDGFNFNYIKELETDFAANCKDCYTCWAMALCDICWIHLFSDDTNIDLRIKSMFCKSYKEKYAESLNRYAQIIEYDPKLLNKLDSDYRKNKYNLF